MATTFRVEGVIAPTGYTLRARLYTPASATAGDCALTESPAGSGQYGGSTTINSLADGIVTPYEYEVRKVATQDATGFTNSIIVYRSRGDYGYLLSEAWYDALAANASGGSLTVGQAADLAAIKAKTALIGVGDITFTGPVVDSDDDDIDLVIVRGDDYLDVDGRAIAWTFPSCPVLTSGSVSLRLVSPLDGSLTTVSGEVTGVGSVLFEMDRDETWALAEGTWRLEVQAILANGDMVQLLAGTAAVTWTLRESVDS